MSPTETAVDRQISFPLSNVLHANGERNGQAALHDFAEDIQFMDIEETSGKDSLQKLSQLQLCSKWMPDSSVFRFCCVFLLIHGPAMCQDCKSWSIDTHAPSFRF